MENEIGAAIQEFKSSVMARIEATEQNIGLLSKDIEKQIKANARASFSHGESSSVADCEHTKSFLDYMRTGREADLQAKSMTAGSDPEGGYLVPTQIDETLTKYLRMRSPMRQLATVINIQSNEYKQPHSVLGTQYTWVGETGARAETTPPSMKLLTIPTFEVFAQPAASQSLLDDNVFDLENWLIQELTDTFGEAEGVAFITGDGVAKPRGLFTYPTVSTADATRPHGSFQYIPTGGAGAFASSNPSDALIQLIYAVKPQYRQCASWLMSPEVLELVRKFKAASTNEYLWQPSNQAGQPATLMGYPVFEDENLPAIAANSLSCAFGCFDRAYTITDRSTSMLRDPFTAKPFVKFYSTKRVGGGGGRDTRAVKFLKFAAS